MRMVITDRFVYIHMPKTGGTFVTELLLRLHGSPVGESGGDGGAGSAGRLARKLFVRPNHYGPIENLEPKHGTCHDIPPRHGNKPVVSTVRNPYDWYVSQYEFAWWKQTFRYHPEPYPTPAGAAIEEVLPRFVETHSRFPDISFAEFIELCHQAARRLDAQNGPALGLLTHSFIRYHYRHPERVLENPRAHPGPRGPELFDVQFLRTDRLNQELHDYLLAAGYREADLRFIRDHDRILPMGRGRPADQTWQDYYTPELRRAVREADRFLFEMFPEFDV